MYTSRVVFIIALVLFSNNVFSQAVTCSSLDTINNGIDSLTQTIEISQVTTLKLSDDIGIMADRIGTMADRIVETEKLLADTLIVLTGNGNLGAGSGNGVVLLKPLDGSTAAIDNPPSVEFSSASSRYLLFASKSPSFPDGETISLYIASPDSLSVSWSQVVSFVGGAGNSLFVAVKSLDANNRQSSLSNGVKLTLQ